MPEKNVGTGADKDPSAVGNSGNIHPAIFICLSNSASNQSNRHGTCVAKVGELKRSRGTVFRRSSTQNDQHENQCFKMDERKITRQSSTMPRLTRTTRANCVQPRSKRSFRFWQVRRLI